MKAFLFALVISISIHFLAFYEIKVDKPQRIDNSDNKTAQKGSQVKLVKLKPKEVKKPIEKKLKKEAIKKKKQEIPKEFKKVEKIKPEPKIIKKEALPIKKEAKKTIPLPKPQVEPFNINDFLNAKDGDEGEKEEELDEITKSYIKLYGEEFTRYSDKTKKYLKESLASIGQITQRYLEYPYLAAYGKQSGTNVIKFFLHPDGKISEVEIISTSGYNILDWNTIDTIEQAYRDYPRPEEKTKIIIYVNYILN